MKMLTKFVESKVEIPRIRVGKSQTIETLINEEALIFAKYLRNGEKTGNLELYVSNAIRKSKLFISEVRLW